MPHALTQRQREYLGFIRHYVAENESSPRLEEIANHFKVKAPTAHKMLEALQSKGYLLFGRDRVSGFFIRLIERAGTSEVVAEVHILGKLDQFGEVKEFPRPLGHFTTVVAGSDPQALFSLVAFETIPQIHVAEGDALIFDYERKPRPEDICMAPFGNRLFLIRVLSKTFDRDIRSDVMASDYPIPMALTNEGRSQLLNWYPIAYTEENEKYFMQVFEEQDLFPRELPDDLILATAIRLSRQLSF